MCAVGRKYGVSDNAARKWLRWYEPPAEQADAAWRPRRIEADPGTPLRPSGTPDRVDAR